MVSLYLFPLKKLKKTQILRCKWKKIQHLRVHVLWENIYKTDLWIFTCKTCSKISLHTLLFIFIISLNVERRGVSTGCSKKSSEEIFSADRSRGHLPTSTLILTSEHIAHRRWIMATVLLNMCCIHCIMHWSRTKIVALKDTWAYF